MLTETWLWSSRPPVFRALPSFKIDELDHSQLQTESTHTKNKDKDWEREKNRAKDIPGSRANLLPLPKSFELFHDALEEALDRNAPIAAMIGEGAQRTPVHRGRETQPPAGRRQSFQMVEPAAEQAERKSGGGGAEGGTAVDGSNHRHSGAPSPNLVVRLDWGLGSLYNVIK